ncbi:hypothetical protein [Planctellipticum variicoloris]|uniref:hypothetical protein n=1 Tax=Planctellipticum variicoloris TaxID=3064265 RepID=UPI003014007A|nr:hypothetical protein SH412_001847 [Planctomycetaceae bacterium SH412]
MPAGLWSQLRDLFRTWWRVDRIRISPREGRLLQLAPPCYLEYGGEFWLVDSRAVGTSSTGSYITYRCSTQGSQAELTVTPARTGWEQVLWIVNGERLAVSADDFEVYRAGSPPGARTGFPGVEF